MDEMVIGAYGFPRAELRRRLYRGYDMRKFFLLLTAGSLLFSSYLFAATPSPAVLKAKQEAEAKGYVFFTDRDEIVAKAQKEGKLRVITSMEPETAKASLAAFKKRYPFIDLSIQPITGS